MPRGKSLNDFEVGKVIALFDEGLSKRAIAKKLGRSDAAIRNVLKSPENYGKKHFGGPKPKITDRDKRMIIKTASNSKKTAAEIAKACNVNVSKWTVHRILRSTGHIKQQKLKTAPRLLQRHKTQRLAFARQNMQTDFFKTIFSDEKKWNLDGPDGFNSYWRDLRKDPQYFSKRNFGGGSLMVWGAFCSDGMLELAFPSTHMDSAEYIGVLRMNLSPFIRTRGTEYWNFQQDNATIHVSRATKSWLEANNIQTMTWPACSPDLNPIENIWGLLVKEVYKENRQYNAITELKSAIIDAWEKITPTTINNLLNSMPNRLFEVISNKGGPTHY